MPPAGAAIVRLCPDPLGPITLTYSQGSGFIAFKDGGAHITQGWAGNGAGKNNPEAQTIKSVGPLPRGLYRVGPWEHTHPGLGPLVAPLTQVEGLTFGRDAFYIHGPSVDQDHYGQESKGCIVIPRPGRERVAVLTPAFIEVTE